MKNKDLLIFAGFMAAGFLVGLSVGKKTRENAPNYVGAQVSGGVVTISADISGAVGAGLRDTVEGWL
jgi:Na+/proline symporter